ncbi:MAG: outer membrane beta-barrel protein [Thiotrichales bacterium]|nr:outer membrane beta-barrel protein [Thiotrichales bacterium]
MLFSLFRSFSVLSLMSCTSALASPASILESAKLYTGFQFNHIFIDARKRSSNDAIDFSLSQQTQYGVIAGVEFPLKTDWSLAAELLWQPNGHNYVIRAPVSVPSLGVVASKSYGKVSDSKAMSLHLNYELNPSNRVFAKVMRGRYDWQVVTQTDQASLPTTTLAKNQGSDFFTAVGLGYQQTLTENWWFRPEAIFFVQTDADKNPLFKFTTYEVALSLGYRF